MKLSRFLIYVLDFLLHAKALIFEVFPGYEVSFHSLFFFVIGCKRISCKDYLSDRRQYISHNGACTEKLKIVSGTMAIFADDTTILSSKRKGSCSIQSDMDNLSQWFCQNRLSINRDKCEAVVFGRGHPSENLILDKKVPYSNACKYLGVYVNKTLRFREPIDYVKKQYILWPNKYIAYVICIPKSVY